MMKKIKPVLKYAGFIILWIFVLAAALFPAWYMNSAYGYLAFLFLVVVLILSLLILLVLRKSIVIDADFQNHMQCVRGDSVELSMKIRNRSVFFCPRAKACFYISDLFGDTDAVMDADFTIAPGTDSSFVFSMDMKHIGVYQAGLKNMKIYDMFGMFCLGVPVKGDFEVHVKPRIHAMDDLVVEEEVFIESGRDSRNTVPNGIDYVGVREYTPGDSMKQIHWKLSAHSVSYMTRLSESSRQSDFAVILDFSAYRAEKEELMDLYDALVETAFSLLDELARREVTYSLIYCDRQQEIHRSVPKGREHDMEYIRRFGLITPEPDGDYPDGAVILNQEARMPNRSTNLIVCTSRITPELIQELVSVRKQRRSPELYLVLPERMTEREREDRTAPLRTLDENNIAWHRITAGGSSTAGRSSAEGKNSADGGSRADGGSSAGGRNSAGSGSRQAGSGIREERA